MDAGAPQILVALEASGLGLAIRQSVWAYPAANVLHVVSVVAFGAAVALLDMLLLGWVPGGVAMARRVRPMAMALFCAVAATGLVLFIAEASHISLNRVFQVKIAVVAFGLLNAMTLGRRAIASASGNASRLPALLSLAAWLAAVALGRLIAYV